MIYRIFVIFMFLPLFANGNDLLDRFSIDGEKSVMEERHLGIINHHLTIGTPYKRVGSIDGLWAPPYVSHDFRLNLKINSQTVTTTHYVWFPMKIEQEGNLDHIKVKTRLFLIEGQRAGILSINVCNNSDTKKDVSVETILTANTLDWSDVWKFDTQQSRTPTTAKVDGNTIFLEQDNIAVIFSTTDTTWNWDINTRKGFCTLNLNAEDTRTIHLAFAMGEKSSTLATINEILKNPEKIVQHSEKLYVEEFKEIFEKLPQFESDNKDWNRLYDRSIMHFFTNRWNVKEFCLQPYYGTGSIRGGCVCNYLWNFGETWEIIHLLDPAASREHIKHFLGLNLTKHYAFSPVTGKAFGRWYMINQEKIIGHVYYYVKLTGDVGFLSEKVHDRTIMDHMMEQALALDDISKPVQLIDYGSSNSHLELRRKFNYYNHVMPDLNGRRYANYLMVAALAEEYGKPQKILVERAELLKKLFKEKLWNRETRWFDFINDQGKPETRYTIQMFKLFGSPILDEEMETGLLSHWNEKEFLGIYGIHSLALQDIAYDPADVDNGGPGACTCFPPQIAERFYKSGHHQAGGDVLQRILWLGEKMPYWGDSFVAFEMNYRHDTPLQCTLDSVSVAQCMIFGMFGIDSRFDRTIAICPHLPVGVKSMSLKKINIRNKTFDINVTSDGYTVILGDNQVKSSLEETVLLKDNYISVSSPLPRKEKGYPVF